MSELKIFSYQHNQSLNPVQKSRMFSVLNIYEREKAKSFKQPLDADISLISRYLLRQILSPLCGRKADEIEFLYNEYNRPYLNEFDFNISHSGNRIAIAANPYGRVGIDIEKIRKVEENIAELCFTEEEKIYIFNNKKFDLEKFFEFWTLKEAFIKADGKGMSYPLLDFYFEIDEKIKLNFKKSDSSIKWMFEKIAIDPEYKMALCYEGDNLITKLEIITDLNINIDEYFK